MSPTFFFLIVLTLTAGAGAAQWWRRARHVQLLRGLARELNMHYSGADRFRLSPRVAERLPVPGAAAVRVFDLIYGIERENYRYVFATEYTTGVLRSKTGCRKIASF